MAPYCSITEWKAIISEGRLVDWTDEDFDGLVNDTIATQCLEEATGWIDVRASLHYTVPLSLSNESTAAWARRLCGCVATYFLVQRLGMKSDNVEDHFVENKEEGELLREGKIKLAGESIVGQAGQVLTFGRGTRVATPDNMQGL